MLSIRKKNSAGFTLIELLIVTALLAVVSLAIYATFNNGIKIWQKINQQVPEENLNIFLENLVSELKNTFNFSGFNFSGGSQQLDFVTLVNSQLMHKYTVGKVSYFYDSESKIIKRSVLDFSQIYEDSQDASSQVVKNVEGVRFQYYFYDKTAKEYLWYDEWTKEGLPLAVKIEVSFLNGKDISALVKTINIPLSN